MWTLLSFTGRFDVAFLQEAIAKAEAKGASPPKMPGERTEQQNKNVMPTWLEPGVVGALSWSACRRGSKARAKEKQGHSILSNCESCKTTKAERCARNPTMPL